MRKVERCIAVFEKDADPLVADLKITEEYFERIKRFISPLDDDPNYWRPYLLNRTAYDVLTLVIADLKRFPYDRYEFYSEAHTV